MVVAVLREFAKNTAPGYKLSLPQHSLRRMLPALMMNVLSHPKSYTSRSSKVSVRGLYESDESVIRRPLLKS